MTAQQQRKLESQVLAFFHARRGETVSSSAAAQYFREMGYTLTRPIIETLQVFGVAQRPERPDLRWHYAQHPQAWRVEGKMLRPVRPPSILPPCEAFFAYDALGKRTSGPRSKYVRPCDGHGVYVVPSGELDMFGEPEPPYLLCQEHAGDHPERRCTWSGPRGPAPVVVQLDAHNTAVIRRRR